MRHSLHIGAVLALFCWPILPAMAASFHPAVIHPAASATTQSSASRMSARANARAGAAVGNPYVNPNVAAGGRSTQNDASANANAAEIRSSHESVTTP